MQDTFQKRILENIDVIVVPFLNLRECAILLDKTETAKFFEARDAYCEALLSNKDKFLRAVAFRAFAACYTDLGLNEKADEMTQKWQGLAREALEP